MKRNFLIIGASYAGIQLAATLRELGDDDHITIIGDEPHSPYQRPPLSKGLHFEPVVPTAIQLRVPEFFLRQRIKLHNHDAVVEIDHGHARVCTQSGATFAYTGLALAVGSQPRRLAVEGSTLEGVITLRTYADALSTHRRMQAARNVVVVGGGLIGMEFAALARRLGKAVVVVETGTALMQRAVSRAVSRRVFEYHDAMGVTIRFGRTLARIVGRAGAVEAVALDDGTVIPADLVVVGIGSEPRTELAASAGLACRAGIVVDCCARASLENIVSAGDCAVEMQPNGKVKRLESVSNALEQAKMAAAALHGHFRRRSTAPWFWSDQGDLRLQAVGAFEAADYSTIEGDNAGDRLAVRHYQDGQLVAIECINCPGEFMAARRLLDRRMVATSSAPAVSAAG